MYSISFFCLIASYAVFINAYRNELVLFPEGEIPDVVKTPRPNLTKAELPESFDYRSLGL